MKLQKALFIFLTLIMALGAAFSGASARQPSEAVVSIAVDQAAFAADQPVTVYVTIANPTGHTIKVLSWYTPIPEVEGSLFSVTVNGAPAAYTGAIYKRPAPEDKDYIKLKAGESVTSAVPLDQYYDLSTSGMYTVTYDVTAANLSTEKNGPEGQVETLTSNTLLLAIEGRSDKSSVLAKPVKPTPTPTPPPGGNTSFNGCTTSQQSTLVSARSQASTYAADALGYLNANQTGERYTWWFGVVSSSRYNHVDANFTAISDKMDNAQVTFDCTCKKRYYAYVYPNDPYKIYLCSVFWTAPLTGTDSKAGTLIHEMSHFYVVASTDDYVYGQTGAHSLALSNPDQAVDNADNHEYFAENTPQRP